MADAAIAASHSSFCAKEVNKGVSTIYRFYTATQVLKCA